MDLCDEGGQFDRVEGGASNSFLNPLLTFVVVRLLFLGGGADGVLGSVSICCPLKDMNVSQRRKATY